VTQYALEVVPSAGDTLDRVLGKKRNQSDRGHKPDGARPWRCGLTYEDPNQIRCPDREREAAEGS
jgi:hypothetical protein